MQFIIDLLKGKYTIVRKSNYYYYKRQHDKLNYVAANHYWFSGFPELKPVWDFVLFNKGVNVAREEYTETRDKTMKILCSDLNCILEAVTENDKEVISNRLALALGIARENFNKRID